MRADKNKFKTQRLERRRRHIRKNVFGTPERPRLAIFRSDKHIYAQVIDDLTGRTIVAASTVEKGAKVEKGGNCQAAVAVGTHVAERAMTEGIKAVVFDRNGFRYHGRIKALADAARKAGLQF